MATRAWSKTPGDILYEALADLTRNDFKRFKDRLSYFSHGGRSSIPRGRLEEADYVTTKNLLIDTYGEQAALDVTKQVLQLINLMGPAINLQNKMTQTGIRVKVDEQPAGFKQSSDPGYSVQESSSMSVRPRTVDACPPPSAAGAAHFVDKYQDKLIQNISMVVPVLDKLQGVLLSNEQYDTVRAENTTQKQMRQLLIYARHWSVSNKDRLKEALRECNPCVIENIESTS